MKTQFISKVILFQNYEKLCLQKPHYLVIKALKQLIYNYITNIPWKYGELKNEMPF
jgi:hypothetical protein